MTAVLVAFIVGFLGIAGQWFLKRQDYQRLDEVAARAEVVAARAEMVATTLAASTSETNEKLDGIHVLVNQQRTDLINEVAALREYIESIIRPGDPTPPVPR